jgi:hypothetical protein
MLGILFSTLGSISWVERWRSVCAANVSEALVRIGRSIEVFVKACDEV